MQGHRVEFVPGFPGSWDLPSDYCLVPDGVDPRGPSIWYLMDPTGGVGALLPSKHSVVVHDDGTITASPSIMMPGGWHGWLERGVWRR